MADSDATMHDAPPAVGDASADTAMAAAQPQGGAAAQRPAQPHTAAAAAAATHDDGGSEDDDDEGGGRMIQGFVQQDDDEDEQQAPHSAAVATAAATPAALSQRPTSHAAIPAATPMDRETSDGPNEGHEDDADALNESATSLPQSVAMTTAGEESAAEEEVEEESGVVAGEATSSNVTVDPAVSAAVGSSAPVVAVTPVARKSRASPDMASGGSTPSPHPLPIGTALLNSSANALSPNTLAAAIASATTGGGVDTHSLMLPGTMLASAGGGNGNGGLAGVTMASVSPASNSPSPVMGMPAGSGNNNGATGGSAFVSPFGSLATPAATLLSSSRSSSPAKQQSAIPAGTVRGVFDGRMGVNMGMPFMQPHMGGLQLANVMHPFNYMVDQAQNHAVAQHAAQVHAQQQSHSPGSVPPAAAFPALYMQHMQGMHGGSGLHPHMQLGNLNNLNLNAALNSLSHMQQHSLPAHPISNLAGAVNAGIIQHGPSFGGFGSNSLQQQMSHQMAVQHAQGMAQAAAAQHSLTPNVLQSMHNMQAQQQAQAQQNQMGAISAMQINDPRMQQSIRLVQQQQQQQQVQAQLRMTAEQMAQRAPWNNPSPEAMRAAFQEHAANAVAAAAAAQSNPSTSSSETAGASSSSPALTKEAQSAAALAAKKEQARDKRKQKAAAMQQLANNPGGLLTVGGAGGDSRSNSPHPGYTDEQLAQIKAEGGSAMEGASGTKQEDQAGGGGAKKAAKPRAPKRKNSAAPAPGSAEEQAEAAAGASLSASAPLPLGTPANKKQRRPAPAPATPATASGAGESSYPPGSDGASLSSSVPPHSSSKGANPGSANPGSSGASTPGNPAGGSKVRKPAGGGTGAKPARPPTGAAKGAKTPGSTNPAGSSTRVSARLGSEREGDAATAGGQSAAAAAASAAAAAVISSNNLERANASLRAAFPEIPSTRRAPRAHEKGGPIAGNKRKLVFFKLKAHELKPRPLQLIKKIIQNRRIAERQMIRLRHRRISILGLPAVEEAELAALEAEINAPPPVHKMTAKDKQQARKRAAYLAEQEALQREREAEEAREAEAEDAAAAALGEEAESRAARKREADAKRRAKKKKKRGGVDPEEEAAAVAAAEASAAAASKDAESRELKRRKIAANDAAALEADLAAQLTEQQEMLTKHQTEKHQVNRREH